MRSCPYTTWTSVTSDSPSRSRTRTPRPPSSASIAITSPPTEFELHRSGSRSAATVDWLPPNPRARGAWANTTDATEQGAYACALAAVELADEEGVTVRVDAVGEEVDDVIGPLVNTAVLVYVTTVAGKHPFLDIEAETPKP